MESRELICIGCPMGCALKAEVENGQVFQVTGNTCKRGEDYAKKEVVNPTRIVTSIVKVEGGTQRVAPVKTQKDIPKEKIFDVIKALKEVTVSAPVFAGDVVLGNAAGTGVDIVAAKNIK